ncbi:MAG: TrkH family potassium uptake protein [Treponema sp.]|nr:TrkH family potassium uptake protein [Treponema sp.]
MKRKAILKLLFFLILMYALAMIFPLGIAVFLGEAEMIRGFAVTITIAVAAALPVYLLTRKTAIRFTAKDGFMLVFLAWVMASVTGALPYWISRCIPGFTDAVFESVSGFSTTGTSIIADLDIMPRSLIFWRAETHWLGGMGMVVLTVALFPFLGIGGFQILKAEFNGPEKERITPKITETAKILWLLYVSLTFIETILLVIAGMTWYDAIIHAFSTMGTGGFSSRNNGLAYWNSPAIVWIVSVFMLIAGYNFTLIYRLLQRKWKDVWYSSEGRAYIGIIVISTLITTVSGSLTGRAGSSTNLRNGFFYTVSVLTTTGLTAGGQSLLTPLAKAALFCLMFIGGCSGSTAGGVKVIRHVVLFKQAGNEIKKIIYPQGVFSVRLNNKVGRKDVVYGVAGFIVMYFAVTIAGGLIIAGSGLNHIDSFNMALLSLGNFGIDPVTFDSVTSIINLPNYAKWTISFLMLTGRLELWTIFVFFSREYWQ